MSDLMDTIERLREARELEELRAENHRLRAELEGIRRDRAMVNQLAVMQSIPGEGWRRALMQACGPSIVGFPPPSLWDVMYGGG